MGYKGAFEDEAQDQENNCCIFETIQLTNIELQAIISDEQYRNLFLLHNEVLKNNQQPVVTVAKKKLDLLHNNLLKLRNH